MRTFLFIITFFLFKSQLNYCQETSKKFKIRNLSINTKNSDFGLIFPNELEDIFYYTSEQSLVNKDKKDSINFFDVRRAQLNKNGTITTINNDLNFINSKFDDGILSFSSDNKKVYFTRTNYSKGKLGKASKDGEISLKIYSAERTDKGWSNIKSLPFNSDKFSTGHPSLSSDGKVLYFISDRPGGFGKTDIYYVNILENDKYSKPINLGKNINSKGREMFPFVKSNALYFSSDSQDNNIGGLDIYSFDLNNKNALPRLLDKPINSVSDDFAYVVTHNKNKGYFSSNRIGGKGSDDIYSFEQLDKNCWNTINFIVRNSNNLKLINKFKIIYDGKLYSNKQLVITKNCNKKQEIVIAAASYKSKTVFLELEENLDTIYEILLEPIRILQRLKAEKRIVFSEDKIKVNIDNIYFDFNSSNLTYDSKRKLEILVLLMKKYPQIKIKISSYTDSKGTFAYNQKLSTERSQAIKKYVWGKEIERDRIFGVGYGETNLVNNCFDNIICNEDKHSENRRTEFEIVEYNELNPPILLNNNANINIEEKEQRYTIQIGAFKRKPNSSLYFNNNVFTKKVNQITKYFYGNYKSKKEALNIKKELINKGIKNAYIIKL